LYSLVFLVFLIMMTPSNFKDGYLQAIFISILASYFLLDLCGSGSLNCRVLLPHS
jgi:hypothetical protein